MDKLNIKELLTKHMIFSILGDRDMDQLINKMEMVSFDMGEDIIKQGEVGDYAYLVYSGRVRVFQQNKEGKHITLEILSRGDLFGERSIIKKEPRLNSVRASDDVVALRISRTDFECLLQDNQELLPYFEKFFQNDSIVNFLRLSTFLSTPSPKQVKALLHQLEESSYCEGEVIFKEGDIGNHLYIVKSGEVKAIKERDGKALIQSYMTEGDYFGELALIMNSPRSATIIATRDTECYTISRDNFNSLIESAPKLREQLLEQIEKHYTDEKLKKNYGQKSPQKPEREQLTYLTTQQARESKKEDKKEEKEFRKKPRIFKRYSWVRQHDETDCGAACLAMISKYYGVRLSVGRLRDMANVGREGTSMYNLATAAETIGYNTRAVKTDYGNLSRLDLPAIAHWKGYHYIVIYKVKKKHVIVGDPAIGLIKMKREEFETGWTGRLLLFSPTPRLEEMEHSKTTFGRFLPLLQPYKFLLVEVFLASLLLDLLGLASPVFTQTIVDKVLVHQNVKMLNILLVGMLLVGAFQTSTTFLRQYLLIHISSKLGLRMISDLFNHLMKLHMRYFRSRKIGDMMTRFGDNENIREILTSASISTVLDVLMVVFYLGLMFYYNPKLTGVALIFIPMFILLTLIFTPIMKRNNQKQFEKQAISESSLIEAIKSIETIKSCTAETTTRWKYENLTVQYIKADFRGAKLDMVMTSISTPLQILSNTVILWYGAHLVINGQLTVGQLMAFQTLIGMVMSPIMGLIKMWQTLQDGLLSLQRLGDIYDAKPEEDPTKKALHLPPLMGHIKFQNVSFRYNPDDKNVLANINLEIQPGETLAIVGRSGSGKTTLASLVQRFYLPTEGKIFVDNCDTSSVAVQSLRSQVGVVLQENTIFSGTIRDNIATSDPDASLDRIMDVAKMANAHDFINSFPMGYDTVIGETGINLSGGQKQRVAIARALLNDPRIIIFDEATSSLDSESEKAIQQNMKSILKDRTALIIAHRLSTIHHADNIIVIDEGVIVEQGNHRELLDKKGLYYYLSNQQLPV